MLPHRLSAAILCALLASGAILGGIPSCGRSATSAGPACCRSEATCPMHQKGALGLNACHRDANNAITVTTHRAVLASAVGAIEIAPDDQTFEATLHVPIAVSLIPSTPPPRRG
ncbi:MAG TPA: hypothetical protein VNN25_10840 [Thermoanaerobaculia bacterium]|nr:hypothetical protein [Thermoanaerobaculia bacterium]